MTMLQILIDTANNPVNWIVIGLSSFLGKIWAARISRKEDAVIQEKLTNLQAALVKENGLLQQAIQNASKEKEYVFQKQCEAALSLWVDYLEIRKESGKFFTPHQLLTLAEKNDPKTVIKFPFDEQDAERSLKRVLEIQTKVLNCQPLLSTAIFSLFAAIVTFYARLGVNRIYGGRKSIVGSWYLSSNNKKDPSVIQIENLAKTLNISLPILSDDPPGFESWRTALELSLVDYITKFVNGSLDRQLEMQEQIRLPNNREQIEQLGSTK